MAFLYTSIRLIKGSPVIWSLIIFGGIEEFVELHMLKVLVQGELRLSMILQVNKRLRLLFPLLSIGSSSISVSCIVQGSPITGGHCSTEGFLNYSLWFRQTYLPPLPSQHPMLPLAVGPVLIGKTAWPSACPQETKDRHKWTSFTHLGV